MQWQILAGDGICLLGRSGDTGSGRETEVSRTVHRVGVSRVVSWDPGFPRRAAGEE